MSEQFSPPRAIGTPLTLTATKVVLLGSGELGKELVIELQRFGVEVIAVDRYPHAPAMQVAQRSHVLNMLDSASLRSFLDREKPDIIIPEIEAIATEVLESLERDATWRPRIIPSARATTLTMDREGIRRLAAEHLGLATSPYRFVDSVQEMSDAAAAVGFPCVIKPVMSSSGRGQSTIHRPEDVRSAWEFAQQDARGKTGDTQRCIVEGFVHFDDEITLLTVRHSNGTTFFDPIHHLQEKGDYSESWQAPADAPQLPAETLRSAQQMAKSITDALGGVGVFGVELFVVDDKVVFSEVSPRPHDTGLVTLGSGDLSEFSAHARAILGMPVDFITRFEGATASKPIKVTGSGIPVFKGVAESLSTNPSVQVRLFGKPRVDGERRVAVVIARGKSVEEARRNVNTAAGHIAVELV